MAKLKISDEWWTAPAEGSHGQLIMVTGRRDMDNVMRSGHYNVRIDVTWPYQPDGKGMPDYATSTLMDKVNEALAATFNADPVAVNTGIYTGEGERNWVFYTRSLHLFQRKLNEALASFELLPLQFHAEEDPDWNEYREMRETEIMDEEM